MKNKLISLGFLFIQLLLSAIFLMICYYVYTHCTVLNVVGYFFVLIGITGTKDWVKKQNIKFLSTCQN